MTIAPAKLSLWRRSIVSFIEGGALIDPQTKRAFQLYAEQRVFLEHAFELTPEGRLRRTNIELFQPKKSGKTG